TSRWCCWKSPPPCRRPRGWPSRSPDGVLQLCDRGVEVVPDLRVGLSEAGVEPHGEIAARDLAEPVRQRPHHRSLLRRRLGLGFRIPAALLLGVPALLGALALEP